MAKLTLADIKRRGCRVDRVRVQATTAAEIDQQAREDGTESDLPGPAYPSPATMRCQLKLIQTDIAALAGVPVATWRNWEQGSVVSFDPAVRTLLRVLWHEPDALRRAMVA